MKVSVPQSRIKIDYGTRDWSGRIDVQAVCNLELCSGYVRGKECFEGCDCLFLLRFSCFDFLSRKLQISKNYIDFYMGVTVTYIEKYYMELEPTETDRNLKELFFSFFRYHSVGCGLQNFIFNLKPIFVLLLPN